MKFQFLILSVSCVLILSACDFVKNTKTEPSTRIFSLLVSSGNNTIKSIVYKKNNTYITTAHSIGDDLSSIKIQNEKNCRVQEKDNQKDIAWIFCDSSKNFEKVYPDRAKNGEKIQVGVYRENILVFLTGAIVDSSAQIWGIDAKGNRAYLSGIVLTDIALRAGDSGAPIFSLETGKWIGIAHTQ